jgi:hypothetical protein
VNLRVSWLVEEHYTWTDLRGSANAVRDNCVHPLNPTTTSTSVVGLCRTLRGLRPTITSR